MNPTKKNAICSIDHVISYLHEMLAMPRFTIPTEGMQLYFELRQQLPYVLEAAPLPNAYIILNRYYKPLFYNTASNEHSLEISLSPNSLIKLAEQQIDSVLGPGVRALFRDRNAPWLGRREAKAYLVRLKTLRSLLSPYAII